MAQELLMGNVAFAHAALEAGVNVVAGYPGTPSTEVIETIAKLRAQGRAQGVFVEWSTNEKAALEMLAGASYSGARTLFTCKQVGLNVASDPLMSLNYVGVKGGMVLFVADDPGPISSQTEQDTRRFAAFAKVPVLDPSTPEEGMEMMRTAFDLSERYATPVIVRPTTRVCHASTYVDVKLSTEARPIDGGFEKDPKWVIFPARAYAAHQEINDRLNDIAADYVYDEQFSRFNPIVEGPQDAYKPRIGIMAGGVSAAYVREALAVLGNQAQAQNDTLPDYRFMQVGTPYPFPKEAVATFVEGLDEIIVFEELDHVLEDELLRFAGQTHASFEVKGKLTGDTLARGENSVDDCVTRLAAFFGMSSVLGAASTRTYVPNEGQELPVRPPVLCAGCPHRGSFYAVKKALGRREAEYCGDIGCYTLGNAHPLDTTDTCLCMGAGITIAQGFSVIDSSKKHIAFVGDSTFFASGITGITNAVYNQHDICVVILDNATTAMTGDQPHPGTGVTLMGKAHEGISIRNVLEALNVKCITEANPLDLEQAVAAAREAIDYEGPSAIIFKSPCVQLIKPQPALQVEMGSCTGCKRCITEIGCPAIGFDQTKNGYASGNRGTAFVDASLCNGCGLCTQLCPSGAIGAIGASGAGAEFASLMGTGAAPATPTDAGAASASPSFSEEEGVRHD